MNRIGSIQLVHLALALAILFTGGSAGAQGRSATAVMNFASVDASGNATPGCGGDGDALTTTLNNALGTAGFDDEGVALPNRRAIYRYCDFLTATAANGWTGAEVATPDEVLGMATFLAPDEAFAAMDNANASFDLQTANVSRRLSLIRLSRRLDRDAAEELAQAANARPRGVGVASAANPNERGAVTLSQADRGERVLLALQNGINAGDEIGGEGIAFFLNGRIHVIEGDSNPSEQASDGFGGGFTLGGDMAINEKFYAGVALGYTRIDTNYDRSASDSSLDAVTISFYGAYYPPIDELFVDGSISVSYLGIDTSNQIIAFDGGPQIDTLDGDTDGVNFGFDVGVGYSVTIPRVEALTIEPFLRLSLLYTEIEGFEQSGGDGTLDLVFNTQRTTSVTSSLGFRSDYAVSTRYGVLTPYFRIAYVHEFNDENDDLKVSLAAVPGSGSFKLRPEATDSHYANIGLGLAATLGQGFSEFLDYDAVVAHDNVTIHQLTAGIRLEF